MKTKNLFATYPVGFRYLLLIIIFICGPTVQNLEAVEPDDVLYAEQTVERNAAYKVKAQQLAEKIAVAADDKEKQNLLVQQQLLTKLKELPDNPEKPSIDLRFSELATQKTLSWQTVEQYLMRYISVSKESKISAQNLENTNKQIQTVYNRLIALGEDSPDQYILQLQHAFQVRKLAHQAEIDKLLKQGLDTAKDQYPKVFERIHIDQQMVIEQEEILDKTKRDLQRLEDEKILSAARHDVLIQQQESLLAGYLGQELTDNEKKVMHYEQLKLLKQQIEQLSKDNQILEGKVSLLEEEQKTIWYRLLGRNPDFFKLTDFSGDISKKTLLLRKKIDEAHVRIYSYEKELSTLRGGNALTGPKAQDLIATLDKKVRTTFTLLSGIAQRAKMLKSKERLLNRAIDLKQSALGSMVTKTREATDEILEKVVSVLSYPLISYNGVSLSLLLLLQVLLLLIFGIIVNRLYGHMVLRMGKTRKWSEQTVHLIQVVGKYLFILIITMLVLSFVGINTRSLTLVAGALSVGIGFGMQTIVNNLVSGIILLFDKSIRPGDFISLGDNFQTGGFRGNVVQMNIRATVLRTNDNINIIIPNADLIASQVVNWTYADEKIRFRVPFSVAYGTDIDKVKSIVREAMLGLHVVLSQPEPQILLAEHADSSLAFVAAVWVEGQNSRQPARTTDTVLTTIYKTLHEHGVEIPFPQMDLHLRRTEQPSMECMGTKNSLHHKIFQETVPQ